MILAVQLAGGIPIISALGDALSAVPSEVFKGHIVRTIRCLENGMSFSTAVKSGRFGTSYVETMLRVGESTGEYGSTTTGVWSLAPSPARSTLSIQAFCTRAASSGENS